MSECKVVGALTTLKPHADRFLASISDSECSGSKPVGSGWNGGNFETALTPWKVIVRPVRTVKSQM